MTYTYVSNFMSKSVHDQFVAELNRLLYARHPGGCSTTKINMDSAIYNLLAVEELGFKEFLKHPYIEIIANRYNVGDYIIKHRDSAAITSNIVILSFNSPAVMTIEDHPITVEPRSKIEFDKGDRHSILPVGDLRFSIVMRQF